MSTAGNVVVGLLGGLHVHIMVLEMFFRDSRRTRKAFGTTPDFALQTKVMAASQGLCNGFVAAGLFWGPALALVAERLAGVRGHLPPGHVQALAIEGLRARVKSRPCACDAFPRRGVGQAVLNEIVAVARGRGYRRLWLETGAMDSSTAAPSAMTRRPRSKSSWSSCFGRLRVFRPCRKNAHPPSPCGGATTCPPQWPGASRRSVTWWWASTTSNAPICRCCFSRCRRVRRWPLDGHLKGRVPEIGTQDVVHEDAMHRSMSLFIDAGNVLERTPR